ncbi:hypothetical protein CALCODRAFT_88230 [Calocera cornea HHB12733]|uniref:Uncharacterized protein n=1 Tax=Calocera cornea HHB12733 TaxID=1353952 RepID=A0A165DCM2_9BASI|nr:hypothetical protein CALCODRAFT_88230 [Calocera cornea HHB12733]
MSAGMESSKNTSVESPPMGSTDSFSHNDSHNEGAMVRLSQTFHSISFSPRSNANADLWSNFQPISTPASQTTATVTETTYSTQNAGDLYRIPPQLSPPTAHFQSLPTASQGSSARTIAVNSGLISPPRCETATSRSTPSYQSPVTVPEPRRTAATPSVSSVSHHESALTNVPEVPEWKRVPRPYINAPSEVPPPRWNWNLVPKSNSVKPKRASPRIRVDGVLVPKGST